MQAQYWINMHRVCQWIVSLFISSVTSWKITTLITNIIGIGVMLLRTLYFNWIKINVSKFLGFFFFFFCLILHFVSFWKNIYDLKVKMLKWLASKKKTSLQFFLHTRVWHFKLSNKLSRLHTIYQNIFSPRKWPM